MILGSLPSTTFVYAVQNYAQEYLSEEKRLLSSYRNPSLPAWRPGTI